MPVLWKDEKHGIGIPAIDAQHKQFFAVVNQFFELDQVPDLRARQHKVVELLKQLFAYAKYHFATEELLFRTYAYSQADTHKEIHKAFTTQIKCWLEDAREHPNFAVSQPMDFLVNWIVGHIQSEDTLYAREFQKAGITPEIHRVDAGIPAGKNMLDLWESQNLSLEIGNLDAQHRELVNILQQSNDLARVTEARQALILPGIIKKLFYYSQFHFSYEEELMSRHGWKGLPAHILLHKEFVQDLLAFLRDLKGGQPASVLGGQIVIWLKDWTIHHILQEDRKFKDSLGT